MEIDPLEAFWDDILSRQPERVLSAFAALSKEEKQAVIAHLKRMSAEPDWHPVQVKSASAALAALGHETIDENQTNQDE